MAFLTPSSGVATPLRAPLRFDENSGRVAVFGALQGRPPVGPIVYSALNVLAHPAALPDANGDYDAFVAVTGQTALAFRVPGARFVVATEGGWTPTPPSRAQVRIPGPGDAGAFAGLASINWMGFGGGAHDLGMYVAMAGTGWLTSADVRPNNIEQEIRHQWRFAPRLRLDTRVRHRRDLVVPIGGQQKRAEVDWFLRLNWSL